MEKKKYSKPVVVAERFEPQEYCVVCWIVPRENVYRSPLYKDTIENGIYDRGEGNVITYGRDRVRIPQRGSINDGSQPSLEIGSFYQDYDYELDDNWDWQIIWKNKVNTGVYSYVYQGRKYYFSSYETNQNAS